MAQFTQNLQNAALLDKYGSYMHLKLFVDSDDDDLRNKYFEAVNTHRNKLANSTDHIDAGFDLFSPEEKHFNQLVVNKLDYKVSCSAKIVTENRIYNTGFYMYPRSSISKSNIRLANNVGIIDAGYRGHLTGMFDVINATHCTVNKFERHVQICAPGLIPIVVELVWTKEELGEETDRGSGGFGSTGLN